LLDRRDLEVYELFRENEQFRTELQQKTNKNLIPLFKRGSKNPKTEHLKTDYSFHQNEPGLYVPIVATLERKRNKAMLNTVTSKELDRTPQMLSSQVKDLSKRQTQKSFQYINEAHQPHKSLRIRTQSSNDQHEDRSLRRRNFLEAVSPEHNARLMTQVLNT